MATKEYVLIDRNILQQIYEISKNLTHTVEDWGWGDKYPEIVEEKVFSETLIDEMKNALKSKSITEIDNLKLQLYQLEENLTKLNNKYKEISK